ncbi:MAG: MoxR family ATPase [Deltaproteobacteria bacterium]|nr:MoxR family ATPase [Deltaproteobacteria bacterium]
MAQAQPAPDIRELHERIQRESAFVDQVLAQVGTVVVGQRNMLERLLIGLLTGGHVLLEGVPGLAKTLTVKTLAESLELIFKRIQFTPDLLPADLIGTQIYQPQSQTFTVKKGPLFANLILADEINRAPAKVQSALLESMQEKQVTIGDTTFKLPSPFLVLATENPIEQEGTYPLPEAQVDRFMLKVKVTYPSKAEEREIMERVAGKDLPTMTPLLGPTELSRARAIVNEIYIDPKVKDYMVDVVVATRDPAAAGLKELVPLIEYGASPRATIYLNLASRAHAFLKHRGFVTPEDVKAVAYDVLRHRVSLTYEAEAENLTPEKVVQRVLEKIEVP